VDESRPLVAFLMRLVPVKRFEPGVRAMRGEVHPMAIRNSLGSLLAFGALNAIGGGYYGLSGAAGVPTEWLAGSPFSDYFIPSLILLFVVGGSFVMAAIVVFAGLRIARMAALAAGLVVLVWLVAQVAIIGYVSWMQPTTAVAGVVILVLAWRLPNPRDPKSADSRR
jgi:peptidoglycan/LPS O-acetylase OafA/YrhL